MEILAKTGTLPRLAPRGGGNIYEPFDQKPESRASPC
jgi:hypothetical protein